MSNQVRPLGRKNGFTLVELLIVVAIIGILSTIGVPTFRRMMQKSKKSEAQVNLGGVYTAEQAFLSEYGTYGNNIAAMGFQIDGQTANLTYLVGFFSGSCTALISGVTGITPTAAAGAGAAVNAAFPTYYVSTGNVAPASDAGFTLMNQSCFAAFTPTGDAPLGATAFTGSGDASDLNQFTAVASGIIAPGLIKTGTTATTDTDIWYIDQGRSLINYQDGIH